MTDNAQKHPDKDQLLSFGLGKLGPDESEKIAQHLDDCADCTETIINLQDDTFVSLVRSSPAPATVDEAELRAAESQGPHPDATVDIGSGIDEDDKGPPVELPAELRDHSRYEIQELIGRGGMGDVYKAQHKVMNRIVALKVIKPELVKNDAAVERFRREVQAAASLRHPNIVTAFDAEQAGNLHYLVMEYVDGTNLDEVISANGRLSVGEACDYIRQAAEGLQHAHDLRMVHRDIKPHNLMIERQTGTIIGSATVVKILDFGLANFANEVAADELSAADENGAEANVSQDLPPGASIVRQLTQMGTMMGTPDYIAPEQAEDAHTADIRSDIYSLGCTLYTLLTGKVPFGEGSVLEKIKAHAQAEAKALADYRDDVPPEVAAILNKMMAKDPVDRFQTPAQVAETLQSVAVHVQPTKSETKVRKATSSSPRRRRPLVLAAVATFFLALIAVAATIFYIQTDNGVVRVEVSDPSLIVAIAGQTLTMDDNGKPLTIRAGEQKLVVRRGDSDFEFETDNFQIRRNDQIAFKVDLLPGEVVVSKDGERFEAKQLPVGAMPKNYEPSEFLKILVKYEPVVQRHVVRATCKMSKPTTSRPSPGRFRFSAHVTGSEGRDRTILGNLEHSLRGWVEKMGGRITGGTSPEEERGNSRIVRYEADGRTGQVRVTMARLTPDPTSNGDWEWRLEIEAYEQQGSPLTIALVEGGEFRLNGQSVGSREFDRLLREAIADNPERVVDINVVKGTFGASHVDMLEEIARNAGAKHVTRPAWGGPSPVEPSKEEFRAVSQEWERLAGRWRAVTWESASRVLKSEDVENFELVVDAEQRTMTFDARNDTPDLTKADLEPSATPKRIDLRYNFGVKNQDAKTTLGIYKLERDELTICLAYPGSPRPDDFKFSTEPNSRRQLFVLRRVESADRNEVNELQLLSSLKGHSGAAFGPSALVATADKRRLLTAGGTDCTARLWDVEAGELLATMKTRSEQVVYAVAISADGKWAALKGHRGDLDIWDLAAEKRLHALSDGNNNTMIVEFTSDGKRLVTIPPKGLSFVWDVATGEKLLQHDLGELCRDAQFVPGTNRLLVAAVSGWWLWDIETNEVTRLGERLESIIGAGALDISADGSKFVSSRVHADQSAGKTINSYPIEIRDLKDGRVLAAAEGPDDFVYCVRFLPGEESVIATSRDKTIRVWNFASSSPDEKSNNRLLLHQSVPQHRNAVAPLSGDQVATFGYASGRDTEPEWAVHLWQLPKSVTSKFPPPNLELIRTLEGHEGAAHGPDSLVTTNDGRLLMSAGGTDRTARLWDVESGEMLLAIKTHSNQIIFQVALSGDGKWAAVRGSQGDLDIWDVQKKQRIHALDDQIENSTFTTFSPDATRIVTIAPKGLSAVWDVATGEKIHEYDLGQPVRDGKFLDGTNRLLFATTNGWWLWDIESKESTQLGPSGERLTTMALDVSADGSTIITSRIERSEGRNNTYLIELRDARNGNLLARGEGHRELATSVRFLAGQRYVVSTARDVTIRIWDTQAKTAKGERIIREIAREEVAKQGWNVAVPLPNNRLASFGQSFPVDPKIGSPIRIWKLPESVSSKKVSPQQASYPQLLKGHEGPVGGNLNLSPDGRWMLSTSNDGTVRVWETTTGRHVATLKGHSHWVNGAMFTPDGKFIVSVGGYKDKTLRIWDADTWQENRQWKLPGQGYKVAMPRHGMDIAVAGEFGMRVYDFETGEEKQVLEQKRLCFSVAYLPRGGIVANVDGRIKLFNERDGKLVWTTEFKEEEYRQGENVAYLFKESILKLDVSPDGKTIAAIGKQGIVYSLSPDNGEILQQWQAHDGLADIKFAPDGKRLFTAGHDKKLRMWDVTTGKLLGERVAETHCTNVLAVLPDGQRVVTGGGSYSQLIPNTTINAYETKTDGDYALRIWRFTEEQIRSRTPLQHGKARFGDTTAESNDEEE